MSGLCVWGAGAIGGTVGAYLRRAGQDVVFVDRAADHVEAIDRAGLHISGPVADFTVTARAFTPTQVNTTFDTVLLCVKAQDTAGAVDAILPHLASDGCIVSVQNGLNELTIARLAGKQRTVGAFVNFGADWLGPGEVQFGGRGAVVVGEIDGRITPRAERLHALLSLFDDKAVLTPNIWGYLWGKLAYGAMLFATALTDDSMADCFAASDRRPLFTALAREILAVAHAAGIRPEAFDGFDPGAYATDAGAAASLDALERHNRHSAKSHSGIWRDLAVRKRRTEADAQLGPILDAARERGVAAPITARLIAMIHEVEEGARPRSRSNLDELARAIP